MNGWEVAAVIAMVIVAVRFGWDLRSVGEPETTYSPRLSVAILAFVMCVMCVTLVRMHPSLGDWSYFPYALAAPCGLGYWLHKKRSTRRRTREASAPDTSTGASR
ncbi:hypothetical protein ACIQTT_11860 [Microbacterium sp. NPDC090225]|uniref:hypothetical protein n=1 Tax=Microbacterium sp. NPDC090225 TaxID=3364207 RepID=UPI0037F360D7